MLLFQNQVLLAQKLFIFHMESNVVNICLFKNLNNNTQASNSDGIGTVGTGRLARSPPPFEGKPPAWGRPPSEADPPFGGTHTCGQTDASENITFPCGRLLLKSTTGARYERDNLRTRDNLPVSFIQDSLFWSCQKIMSPLFCGFPYMSLIPSANSHPIQVSIISIPQIYFSFRPVILESIIPQK